MTPKTRICYRCHNELPLTAEYFQRDKTRGSVGLRYICKECKRSKRKRVEDPRQVLVILAMADRHRVAGVCRGCKADISHRPPQTHWCGECWKARRRIKLLGNVDYCEDCGVAYQRRPSTGIRCPICQRQYALKKHREDMEIYRRKQMEVVA